MIFDQTIRNIKRVGDVIRIFAKYGFEDIITTTPLQKFIPRKQKLTWMRHDRSIFEFSRAERIRMVIEELGPTFIKGAQMLSNRPDLLPADLIVQLEMLQDNVKPDDFAKIKPIIEKELGMPIDEVYDFFDEKALGSASIGQVHRARLKTGEDVAVKIQRAGVREKVHTDLSLIRDLINLTETYLTKYGILNPYDILNSFERSITRELSYVNEARNMENFRKLYRNYDGFSVPKVYERYSTDRVLTMEYISGAKITDVEKYKPWGVSPSVIAEKGMDAYLHQIFDVGVFHADPHPGNILIRPGSEIVLIDYGMTGKLSRRDKINLAGMLTSMAGQDARAMAGYLKRLTLDNDVRDMRMLEYDLEDLIENFAGLTVEQLNMQDLVTSLYKVIFDYKLTLPGSVFLILRAMVILEGIGKQIHPGFNVFEFIKPYGKKIIKEQYKLEYLGQDFVYSLTEFIGLVTSLPADLKDLLTRLQKGTLTIQVENKSTERLAENVERGARKLVVAMLMCTLILAGTLVLVVPGGLMTWLGIPILSWVGYGLAFFLGFYLFIQFFRNVR